jgi:uncharacterized membrane protein YqgA involved in biofilm formation
MIGTFLNVAGILAGGVAGLARPIQLTPARESALKVFLGAFTVYYGLRLTWLSLNGAWTQILKQLLVAVLALMLGKLAGRLLHLQMFSNHLGRAARARIADASSGNARPPGDGFKACALLFCAAPLGLVGALQDGLSRYFYPLGVKAVMEGLAAMGFARLFGWGVLLSALPVLALQGTLTLMSAQYLEPFLTQHLLLDSVNAVGGLLVFCVGLVVLQLKRIELADYLPSLAIAPLLTWVWR